MKILVIVTLSFFLTSCSYAFSQPPFQKDELTEITKSEFGKELLSHIENFPDIEQAGNSENNLTKDTWVYVVADDFLIQQKEKDESPGWDLIVWTKNRHHIISCSLMQDENDERLFENNRSARGQSISFGWRVISGQSISSSGIVAFARRSVDTVGERDEGAHYKGCAHTVRNSGAVSSCHGGCWRSKVSIFLRWVS